MNVPEIKQTERPLTGVKKVQSLEDIATKSLELEASAPYGGERFELYGKNNLEAAIATLLKDAAEGSPEARKEVLDRVLGKPLQRQNIVQTNLTLVGFLDRLAETDGIVNVKDIVDAAEPPYTTSIRSDDSSAKREAPEDISEAEDGLSVLR